PPAASPAVIMDAVRQHGLEGVMAKRKDSIYECGKRSGAWQKLPLKPKDEFIIGAYRLDGRRLEIYWLDILRKKISVRREGSPGAECGEPTGAGEGARTATG